MNQLIKSYQQISHQSFHSHQQLTQLIKPTTCIHVYTCTMYISIYTQWTSNHILTSDDSSPIIGMAVWSMVFLISLGVKFAKMSRFSLSLRRTGKVMCCWDRPALGEHTLDLGGERERERERKLSAWAYQLVGLVPHTPLLTFLQLEFLAWSWSYLFFASIAILCYLTGTRALPGATWSTTKQKSHRWVFVEKEKHHYH